MKKNILVSVLGILSTICVFAIGAMEMQDISIPGTLPHSLRIVTYNIRRAGSEKNQENLWDNRKHLTLSLINAMHPDVIGFQEVVKNQLDDLRSNMPQYSFFGDSRKAFIEGNRQRWVMKHPNALDEANPIAYNKERLSLLSSGTFGINPGGTLLPRICTFGKFKDQQTGKEFYVYNTHLSNTEKGFFRRLISGNASHARKKQIEIIMAHVKRNTGNLPVVFMGDLNTRIKGRKKQRMFTGNGFEYAKNIAKIVSGPVETRTGWNNSELKIIDHIYIKAPNAVVEKYEVVKSPENVFPSDHRPVMIDVKL
jgi:endonuclease/exonuclease/phosphatase family metal-dependent hydrolase